MATNNTSIFGHICHLELDMAINNASILGHTWHRDQGYGHQ